MNASEVAVAGERFSHWSHTKLCRGDSEVIIGGLRRHTPCRNIATTGFVHQPVLSLTLCRAVSGNLAPSALQPSLGRATVQA